MASLMENLIHILEEENTLYKQLLELSRKKTPIIIEGVLETLQQITDEEQNIVAKIQKLEGKREENIKDIATVLNRDVSELKLKEIIKLLEPRKHEQQMLANIHDVLSDTIAQVVSVNEQNKELINSSLEMVQFDITLLQSMKQAPQTANYNSGAYTTGIKLGSGLKGFDAI